MIKKTSLSAQGVCFLGGVTCGGVGVVSWVGVVLGREGVVFGVEVFRRLVRRLVRCLGEVCGSI